jgi:sugar/nucleoside kinase (ribokinase family)
MIIAAMGVSEVIVTLGSKGSLIYTGGVFYEIPAYTPDQVVDATGCGDTYMAGYLYKRARNFDCVEAGKFGAAMATLKIESSGPFTGSFEDVSLRIVR